MSEKPKMTKRCDRCGDPVDDSKPLGQFWLQAGNSYNAQSDYIFNVRLCLSCFKKFRDFMEVEDDE